jgi:choline kinase
METAIAIQFVENSDPTTPNGESLLVAERAVGDRFFLQMVDHLFAEPVLPRLALAPFDGRTAGRVLVDRAPANLDLADATKVCIAGDRVTAIGKGLDPWDAIDAGCFLLSRAIFDALRSVPAGEPRTVSSGMRQLVAQRALGAQEIAGIPWVDVDTPADRAEAERLAAAAPQAVVEGASRL